MKKIKQAKDYHLDDPNRTLAHRDIILSKPFLKKLYAEWYAHFTKRAKTIPGKYLELGSGGGFLKDVFPEVITSDILPLDTVDMVCDAQQLPFDDGSIAGIMMLNVFHHIPKPHLFLAEAQRVLIPGGKILMTEPANSFFSRFVYTRFHHEPFAPSGAMEIEPGNPLSNSNQALPYIYFEREREIFVKQYPLLKITCLSYHTPFSYLLSGGLSRPAMLPGGMYGFTRFWEKLFTPFYRQLGLFCSIEIEKQ